MLKLNGKKLARTEKEFTDSLFSQDGTCVGFYKPNKKSITIMDHKKNKVGAINCHGVLCRADIIKNECDNGKKVYWYSYGDIDIIGPYKSYTQQREEITYALSLLA